MNWRDMKLKEWTFYSYFYEHSYLFSHVLSANVYVDIKSLVLVVIDDIVQLRIRVTEYQCKVT